MYYLHLDETTIRTLTAPHPSSPVSRCPRLSQACEMRQCVHRARRSDDFLPFARDCLPFRSVGTRPLVPIAIPIAREAICVPCVSLLTPTGGLAGAPQPEVSRHGQRRRDKRRAETLCRLRVVRSYCAAVLLATAVLFSSGRSQCSVQRSNRNIPGVIDIFSCLSLKSLHSRNDARRACIPSYCTSRHARCRGARARGPRRDG